MKTWWSRLNALMRRFAAGEKADRALDDELQAYLREDIECRIRSGDSPDEARRAALAELGGVEQVKEHVRDARTGASLETLLQDLRYGVRTLVKTPGYSLSVVGSLSLGIASMIVAVAFANSITFRPFPGVRDQGELVEVRFEECYRSHSGCIPMDTRHEDYLALRETVMGLQGIAASTPTPVAAALPDAQPLSASLVSTNYFDVLGTTATVSRTFASEESNVDRAGVAVISHRLWLREFGADPAVLGRAIRVADQDVVIMGVAPGGFAGVDLRVGRSGPDVWLPMPLVARVANASPTSDDPPTGDRYYRYIGRLAQGSSPEQVRAQAETVARHVAARNGSRRLVKAAVSPVRIYPTFKIAPLIALVLGVAAIVLVIACVNAANLLLARGSARQHEIAIRIAIGANRYRIVRQLLTETLLLAMAAAVLAVPLVAWAVGIASEYLTVPMPLDLTVLAVTVFIAGTSAVACGLLPAFRVTAQAPAATFSPAQATSATRAQTRGRRAILVVQVALSLGLLAGGVQLVTALKGLDRSSGTPPDRLLIASFDLKQLNFREADAEAFYAGLLDRVSRLPGVEAAGLAPTRAVWTFNRGKARDNSIVVWRAVDPPRQGEVPVGGYAAGNLTEALGLHVLQGRTFTDDDRRTRLPQVAIVNRRFADRLLDGQALGATLRVALRSQPYTAAIDVRVVGVIEATQEPSYVRDPPYSVETIYLPAPLEPAFALALYVRARDSAAAIAPAVRDIVRQIDARVPILQLESLAQANERFLVAENTLARATAILGLIALFLATWGLYGVLSYIVTLRSREIAVRLALGAKAAGDVTHGAVAGDDDGGGGDDHRRRCSDRRRPRDSVGGPCAGRSQPGRDRVARRAADRRHVAGVRDPGREGGSSQSVAVAEGELTLPGSSFELGRLLVFASLLGRPLCAEKEQRHGGVANHERPCRSELQGRVTKRPLVGVHQPAGREHRGERRPRRRLPPPPLDHADHRRGEQHRGEEESLLDRESARNPRIGLLELANERFGERPRRPSEPRGAQPVLCHERAPRADPWQEADNDGGRMLAWRCLKCLRDDHHADPENDRHPGLDGDRPRDPGQRTRDADGRHECAVQDRIPGARAHRLPAGMPDVDRRRKRGSQERGRDTADAINR